MNRKSAMMRLLSFRGYGWLLTIAESSVCAHHLALSPHDKLVFICSNTRMAPSERSFFLFFFRRPQIPPVLFFFSIKPNGARCRNVSSFSSMFSQDANVNVAAAEEFMALQMYDSVNRKEIDGALCCNIVEIEMPSCGHHTFMNVA